MSGLFLEHNIPTTIGLLAILTVGQLQVLSCSLVFVVGSPVVALLLRGPRWRVGEFQMSRFYPKVKEWLIRVSSAEV